MAGPFSQPNPYGSYFNFSGAGVGDPTWNQPNYPNLGTPLSAGVQAAAGAPVGGFNPTSREFQDTRRRDIAYQQFIDRAIKDDPRTHTAGTALLDAMYGNDTRAKTLAMTRFGGPDAFQGMIGTIMNMPGVSGYFGGSVRSQAVGALATATSGMTLNGYNMFGDQRASAYFANSLMSNIQSKFYSSNGNPISSMTNGVNRDQFGGVMMMAASQGAFSGMDMGKFQKMDAAGNNVKFLANDATLSKITSFMKDTSKALGSLIDVYGDISANELMQKAQQITGLDLSRLGNAKLMSDRIQKLRDTARITGIDNQSAFDMSARAGMFASSIGSSPEMAGTIGFAASQQGAMNWKLRNAATSSFYTHATTMMEEIQASTTNMVGMTNDPLGSRFSALEMMIRNSGVSSDKAAELRRRATGFSATAGGLGAMDAMMQREFGVNTPAMIRGMGGAQSLLRELDPTQQSNVVQMLSENMAPRQSDMIRRNMFGMGLSGTVAEKLALHKLVTTFQDDTISKLLDPKSSPSNIISAIAPAMKYNQNASDFVDSINAVRAMGSDGVTQYHNVRSMIQANPLTRNFITQETRMRNGGDSTPIPDDFRGSMLGGNFMAGLVDRYSGHDPISRFAWVSQIMPESVFGWKKGQEFSSDFGSFVEKDGVSIKHPEWQENLRHLYNGLNGSEQGRALIKRMNLTRALNGNIADQDRLYNQLRDPDSRAQLFDGFKLFSRGLPGGGHGLAGVPGDIYDLSEKYGDAAAAYMTLARDKHIPLALRTSFHQRANMLTSGYVDVFDPHSGTYVRHSGKALESQLAAAADPKNIGSEMFQLLKNSDMTLSEKTLRRLRNQVGSSEALGMIRDLENSVMGEDYGKDLHHTAKTRKAEMERLEKIKSSLIGATPSTTVSGTTTSLTGQFTFKGDPSVVLELMNGQMTTK